MNVASGSYDELMKNLILKNYLSELIMHIFSMFNIILTGKILDETQFKKLIDKIVKIKKEKKINQIILSIWKKQTLSKEVSFFLKK